MKKDKSTRGIYMEDVVFEECSRAAARAGMKFSGWVTWILGEFVRVGEPPRGAVPGGLCGAQGCLNRHALFFYKGWSTHVCALCAARVPHPHQLVDVRPHGADQREALVADVKRAVLALVAFDEARAASSARVDPVGFLTPPST